MFSFWLLFINVRFNGTHPRLILVDMNVEPAFQLILNLVDAFGDAGMGVVDAGDVVEFI